ncbi:MAG TPA: hypothetical protein PKA77_07260 [Chitinophagaceae bacterium]|jgi:hypothetical protein|nr:hypothetical protein [Chitinophagaceae bacterium]
MKKILSVILCLCYFHCFSQTIKGDTLILPKSSKIQYVKIGDKVYPLETKGENINTKTVSVEGEWVDCDGSGKFYITKSGNNLIIHTGENEYTLEKKSNDLYSGAGGLIVLTYDNSEQVNIKKFKEENPGLAKLVEYDLSKKRWSLSGPLFEKTIYLCRKSEMG